MERDLLITGFASVTPAGPVRGLPPATCFSPEPITRWTTAAPRRAIMVPPFRSSDVVPGLRTRRMDRLAVWAVVASALALQDGEVAAGAMQADRTAVVCGTQFGAVGLTAEFLRSLATHPAKADPVVFPETLSNLPASHLANQFDVQGPNLTIVAGRASGEAAIVTAASLLHSGEADRALVLSGDTLTREIYEWYEAASLLAPSCADGVAGDGQRRDDKVVPGEGLAVCLLETRQLAAARRARVYGRLHGSWFGPTGDGTAAAERVLRQVFGDAGQERAVTVEPADRRASWLTSLFEQNDDLTPDDRLLRAGPRSDFGDFGGAGVLRLGAGLVELQASPEHYVLVADAAGNGGQAAAILLAREDRA